MIWPKRKHRTMHQLNTPLHLLLLFLLPFAAKPQSLIILQFYLLHVTYDEGS